VRRPPPTTNGGGNASNEKLQTSLTNNRGSPLTHGGGPTREVKGKTVSLSTGTRELGGRRLDPGAKGSERKKRICGGVQDFGHRIREIDFVNGRCGEEDKVDEDVFGRSREGDSSAGTGGVKGTAGHEVTNVASLRAVILHDRNVLAVIGGKRAQDRGGRKARMERPESCCQAAVRKAASAEGRAYNRRPTTGGR